MIPDQKGKPVVRPHCMSQFRICDRQFLDASRVREPVTHYCSGSKRGPFRSALVDSEFGSLVAQVRSECEKKVVLDAYKLKLSVRVALTIYTVGLIPQHR